MLGQIDGRLHKELVLGALSIRIIGCWVQAIFVLCDIHLQIAVGTEKPPFRKNFPFDERLDSVSSAAHFVTGHERIDNVGWSRTTFHKRLARFCRPQVGVIVIEGGNVQRHGFCNLDAIAEFIGE